MNSHSDASKLPREAWHDRFPHGLLITPALVLWIGVSAMFVLGPGGLSRLDFLVVPLIGLASLAVFFASPIALINRRSPGLCFRRIWVLVSIHTISLLLAVVVFVFAGYTFYQINLE